MKPFDIELNHKEVIEPSIKDAIIKKNHYNADNSIFPETIGRGNFMLDVSNQHFHRLLGKIKRNFDTEDINPKKYFEIKTSISTILKNVRILEQKHEKQLNELAINIITNYFNIPNNINFVFENSLDNLDFSYDDLINSYANEVNQIQSNNYQDITKANEKIDRNRFNYCFICGGANTSMEIYKNYSDILDSIDYRLQSLYDKFISFNNFNLWVTPDNILTKTVDNIGGFKIFENEIDGYNISIDAPNFLSKLYEMSKAVLSILFQEKYNNQYIDYDNAWNTRIGTIIWHKLLKVANKKDYFADIIDRINSLDDEDYSYIMKEILLETNHSKDVFKWLMSEISKGK